MNQATIAAIRVLAQCIIDESTGNPYETLDITNVEDEVRDAICDITGVPPEDDDCLLPHA